MTSAGQAWAVVVAAGSGSRMGPGVLPKPYLSLAGQPVLARALAAFEAAPQIAGVIVVAAAEHVDRCERTVVHPFGLRKVRRIVAGGASRQASVARGLGAVPNEAEWIAVHDGARPLLTPDLIDRCLAAARRTGAAIAGLPVKETIKSVTPAGLVAVTPPREALWSVQTPQVFRAAWLREAHARSAPQALTATDDAALVEALGYPVAVVPGDPANVKITTPEDLAVAEAFISEGDLAGDGARQGALRVGIGYDVHRLVPDRPLILGGVRIEHERGLLGHSDADVLLHAIMDALLGAAGLGDIGRHFPDSDPAYAGISSLALLERVAGRLAERSWVVQNVDATVVAEQPRIAPHAAAMISHIAGALQIAPEQVNLKATTGEGLGFTGRGEGIAAWATAALMRWA